MVGDARQEAGGQEGGDRRARALAQRVDEREQHGEHAQVHCDVVGIHGQERVVGGALHQVEAQRDGECDDDGPRKPPPCQGALAATLAHEQGGGEGDQAHGSARNAGARRSHASERGGQAQGERGGKAQGRRRDGGARRMEADAAGSGRCGRGAGRAARAGALCGWHGCSSNVLRDFTRSLKRTV